MKLSIATLALASMVAAGCGSSSTDTTLTPPSATVRPVNFVPKSDAGLPVTQDADPAKFTKLVAAKDSQFGKGRPDPFALTPAEMTFEREQESERIFSEIGGFTVRVEPKPEVETPLVTEPQPYRRLSGIVVGDSVLAIIEMGEGRQPEIIRPGMRIPNSEWRVVSIDQEKAVLRRDGSQSPKEIIVRLETPRFGTAGNTPGSNVGGGFPGGGGPPGGIPGASFPGGRGKGGGGSGGAGVQGD